MLLTSLLLPPAVVPVLFASLLGITVNHLVILSRILSNNILFRSSISLALLIPLSLLCLL